MKSVHDGSRLCRVTNIIGLAATLGLVTIGITQCRMVGDTVTGVRLRSTATAEGRGNCIKDCNTAYKRAINDEADRHKAALRACGRDQDCKRAENILHDQNEKNLLDQRRNCKRGCYNEGGGGGGDDGGDDGGDGDNHH